MHYRINNLKGQLDYPDQKQIANDCNLINYQMRCSLLHALMVTLLTASLLIGCSSLKNTSDFSASAFKGIQKFEEIDYGFEKNCLENCYSKTIAELNLESPPCNCAEDKKGDQVTLAIYKAVRGYLDGLTKLSNNKLTAYNLESLSDELKKIENPSLKIEKSQVEAYGTISRILLRSVTDKYRKHQLRDYLVAGNEPFQVLIACLKFNLSENLSGKLSVQKEILKEYYFVLLKDTTLTTWERREAVETYYKKRDQIELIKKQLLSYSKTLQKIGQGEVNLAEAIDKPGDQESKAQLNLFVSELQQLIDNFNKLTIQ